MRMRLHTPDCVVRDIIHTLRISGRLNRQATLYLAKESLYPYLRYRSGADPHLDAAYLWAKRRAVITLLQAMHPEGREMYLNQFIHSINHYHPMSTELKKESTTIELSGDHYAIDFTVSPGGLTIQKVTPATDQRRDIMKVMDPEILKQVHESLSHEHLNHSA